MYYVSEGTVQKAVKQADVTGAIEKAFLALADGSARNFPVVRETLNYADAVFGFKSGFIKSGPVLGIKAGGLWPGNAAKGIANHQSTIALFDPESGSPKALVRGTYLTALRTAAASALSIRALARSDAKTLGILGAGGQSVFQVKAAMAEHQFSTLLVYDLSTDNANRLKEALDEEPIDVRVADAQTVCSEADVLITVTPAREAIVKSDWIKPGTHLACMGADTKGKQEVEAALVGRANLFGDEAQQAVTLGECQHAFAENLITESDITTLGLALVGKHPGRGSDEEITLFDSTGMGLQDLVAAELALDIALSQDLAHDLPD
ncbi:MAG: ornithine cyclodeaminase family protein [Pseudomonadota bacterium]